MARTKHHDQFSRFTCAEIGKANPVLAVAVEVMRAACAEERGCSLAAVKTRDLDNWVKPQLPYANALRGEQLTTKANKKVRHLRGKEKGAMTDETKLILTTTIRDHFKDLPDPQKRLDDALAIAKNVCVRREANRRHAKKVHV